MWSKGSTHEWAILSLLSNMQDGMWLSSRLTTWHVSWVDDLNFITLNFGECLKNKNIQPFSYKNKILRITIYARFTIAYLPLCLCEFFPCSNASQIPIPQKTCSQLPFHKLQLSLDSCHLQNFVLQVKIKHPSMRIMVSNYCHLLHIIDPISVCDINPQNMHYFFKSQN